MEQFQEIDRYHTNSVKWDTIEQTYREKDLLPLWVADMDFKAHQPILDAMGQVLKQGVLGYTIESPELVRSVINWQQAQHQVKLDPESILFSSGVIPSLAIAIQAFTEENDQILIFDPVYPPFADMIKRNGRQVVRNSLKVAERFEIDFASLEQQLQEGVKAVILCNPHNPGGRVWTRSELQQLAQLCAQYNVLVISDEIHGDLVFAPHTFTSFYSLEEFRQHAIVLTSATKTFNLAGIKNSMIFIDNPQLRQRFIDVQARNRQNEINTFGQVGTQAAYETGADWLKDLLTYLEGNVNFVCDFFAENLPEVGVMKPEGTYLIWLDFSAYGLSDQALQRHLIREAKVVLNPGNSFGPGGTGHMRLNIACTKATLAEGLTRIQRAFAELPVQK